MTALDIVGALDALPATGRTGEACKIQRWLDTIPTDAPGRDNLVEAFTTTDERSTHYRTYDQLLAIASRLGLPTSDKTIAAHRKRTCRCSW